MCFWTPALCRPSSGRLPLADCTVLMIARVVVAVVQSVSDAVMDSAQDFLGTSDLLIS